MEATQKIISIEPYLIENKPKNYLQALTNLAVQTSNHLDIHQKTFSDLVKCLCAKGILKEEEVYK